MNWNYKPKAVREKIDVRWYLVPPAITAALLGLALLTQWIDPAPTALDSRVTPAAVEAPTGA